MRRWVWRGALAMVALVVVIGGAVGVKAFSRACDGSLEGLRYLANVRTQIAVVTALPPTPTPVAPTPIQTQAQAPAAQPTPTPTPVPPPPAPPTLAQQALAVAGQAGDDAAIVGIMQVKQDDAVAYPAHIVAAHALDAAGCGQDAVRLQWLKAGLHASRAGQPERIAAALEAGASGPDDLAELRRLVRVWTERASQSVSLRRVLTVLDERS